MLDLPERELSAWERQELIPPRDQFGFDDLIELRALSQLRDQRVPVARIRQALEALRDRLRDVKNPLTELKIFADERRVRVVVGGQTMEPVSGQLLLNFDAAEMNRLLRFPSPADSPQEGQRQRLASEEWFERGVTLERTGAPYEDIVRAYQEAVRLDPEASGPHLNLGTVYFNARRWQDAEKCYQQALAIHPEYPLAHFNLANLYEERGNRNKALEHYQTALQLHANYADAHYNIALLYQSLGQSLKAVQHWQAFLRLDPNSSWAEIARRELEKLRRVTVVKGARSTPPPQAGAGS